MSKSALTPEEVDALLEEIEKQRELLEGLKGPKKEKSDADPKTVRINPSSLVLSKEDEHFWDEAKKAVKKEYAKGKPYAKFTEDNWRQVAGIFRNIKEFKAGKISVKAKRRRKNPLPDLKFEGSDE